MTATVPVETERPRRLADDLGRFGDTVALVSETGSLSYAALDERVATVAQRLGVTPRLVMVAADNTVDAVVGYLAALRGRHPVILVPPGDSAARDALIATYDPDVMIDGAALVERRDASSHDLHGDLALLLATSGSTGSPKLVRLSQDNIVSNAAAIVDVLGITPADRAITSLPLHYCYGLSVLNSYLFAGASVVLSDLSVVDACFWRLARESAVTSVAGVPHTFELLDRIGFTGAELPSLRYLTQAGGPMPPERVGRYARLGAARGFDLVVMYGQTEATARMAYLPPALALSHPSSIGVAIPGGALRIDELDGDGVGELVYRGDNVMLGYAHKASDLALGATLSELRTGDLARCDGDGVFQVVGRRSRFIKPFGVRVDLDAIEALLADAGLVAVCTGDDHRLVVGVQGAGNVTRATSVVTARLKLPASHVAYVALEAVPRVANGKPDYAAVAELADGVERRVASVRDAFVAVLGVEPQPSDTFVGLGGDSLSYVEMSISLEDILGALPRDWHTMALAALEAMAAPTTRSRTAALDTTLAVRAAAIVLIVGTHAGAWQVKGGAHALIAIAGFNFARFQLTSRGILQSVTRLAVPAIAWITAVSFISDKYGWSHRLLVNDVFGPADALWSFWFIEAIVQISLVIALLLAVPAVSRFERQRPFGAALVALAVGLCARFDVVPQPGSHPVTWPHELFWLFALGWVAARATATRHRVLVTIVAVVATPGFFVDSLRALIVIGAIAAITWLPTITVPRPVVRVVLPLAGASLYIYLTHLQIYSALSRSFGPVVSTLGSLLVGVGAWRAVHYLARVVRTRKATGITLTSSRTSAGSAAVS